MIYGGGRLEELHEKDTRKPSRYLALELSESQTIILKKLEASERSNTLENGYRKIMKIQHYTAPNYFVFTG